MQVRPERQRDMLEIISVPAAWNVPDVSYALLPTGLAGSMSILQSFPAGRRFPSADRTRSAW